MRRNLALVAGLVGSMTLTVAAAQEAKLVQAGKDLYSAKACARCHMVEGKGYKAGKLEGAVSKLSAEDMRRWLTAPAEMESRLDHKPKVRMSSRKNMKLTDSDVTSLVAYLRTLK